MKTIVGHIDASQVKQADQRLLHHFVIYQLGRRYACEEILLGTPIDKILVTMSLKFIPSQPYTLSMLQQAVHLLQAPKQTIQAYSYYLKEHLEKWDSTSPLYQWWQDELEFFNSLEEEVPVETPEIDNYLKRQAKKPLFTVSFQQGQLYLQLPIFNVSTKQIEEFTTAIEIDDFSLNQLKKKLYENRELKPSVELVWCGSELYVLIDVENQKSGRENKANHLPGDWNWVNSPFTKIAAATILTLQGVGVNLSASAQETSKKPPTSNPFLPAPVSKPVKSPIPSNPSLPTKITTPSPPKKPVAPLPKKLIKPISPLKTPAARTVTPPAPKRITPPTPARVNRKTVAPSVPALPKPATKAPKRWKPAPRGNGAVYVVSSGETLATIAQKMLGHAGLWSHIYSLNRRYIRNPHRIHVGQRLNLPSKQYIRSRAPYARRRYARASYSPKRHYKSVARSRVYRVRPGDTLSIIARRMLGNLHRWPVIYRLNRHKLRNPHRIYVGQRLVLPWR